MGVVVMLAVARSVRQWCRQGGSTICRQPGRVDMRLVSFVKPGKGADGPVRVGVEIAPGGDVIDLAQAEPHESAFTSMRAFLAAGSAARETARRIVSSGVAVVPRGEVRLIAPVPDPQKVLCVGMNYVDHCAEQGLPVPKEPVLFAKFPTAVCAPDADVVKPKATEVCVADARICCSDGSRRSWILRWSW